MGKKEGSGKPFNQEDAEIIKIRSEGLQTLTEIITEIPVDSDIWAIALSPKKRGVCANEGQIPKTAHAMITLVASMASEIENPIVMLEFIMAVSDGFSKLSAEMKIVQTDFAKKAVERMSQEAESEGMAESAAAVLRFLQKMEKENENSEGGVPDTGGS